MAGAGNQFAQRRQHLTAVADAEREARWVGQEAFELLSQLLANLASLRVDTVRTEVQWDAFELNGFLAACGFKPSQRLAFSLALV